MSFPASHLRLLLGILLGVCAFLALAGEEKETYYDVLGVEQKATDDEIKKAYRKMAVQYHPDKYQGDKKEAEERFIRIAEAYETLSNPAKRNQYDASLAGGAGGFDFGAAHHFSSAQADEMFDEMFKDCFKGFEDMFKGFDADPFAAFGGGGGGGSASFSTSFSSSSSSSFSSFSSSSGGSFSSQKGYSKSVAHRNVNGKQETIVTEKWTEPNGTVKTKTTRKTSDGQEYITEEAHNKEHQAVAGSDKTAVAEDRGQQPHVDPFAGVFGSIFEEL
uniref:J domain-containing protein n=1 Tax=Vitrella brassicaformis TaxID=1169539 RepID=A0A7S1KB51_9ALVE|mmetsp:Transcript_46216/g.114967  ORF Transcript_46216/g.114967 Transcript_46216/m.114967 type:complete len:275 (+) Transcript_46216:273-1097(+)